MNPQIVEALQLASKIQLNPKEGELSGPTYKYISDLDAKLNYQIKEANFEIKYMMACGQLGFTDPEVTQYVRKRLAGK
jgi:hypothetical protein